MVLVWYAFYQHDLQMSYRLYKNTYIQRSIPSKPICTLTTTFLKICLQISNFHETFPLHTVSLYLIVSSVEQLFYSKESLCIL